MNTVTATDPVNASKYNLGLRTQKNSIVSVGGVLSPTTKWGLYSEQ